MSAVKYLIYLGVIAIAILVLPANILLDIESKEFESTLPKSLDGYTSIENVKVTEFKVAANILGPESVASFNGKLVTGSADGYIYQIDDSNPDNPKRLLKIIDNPEPNKNVHGRPLGLKFDSKGVLFVVEPEFGIYKVENIFGNKPKVVQVFDIKQTSTLGKASKFLDDVAIEERPKGGHVLYISDVSTKFSLEEFVIIVYGSDMGRIIRYDTDSKKLNIIADNLFFPNGVEVSKNNEALLFAETVNRNVWKYHLKGDKKDTLEAIAIDLPGELDNIRLSPNGKTFWIAVLSPRTSIDRDNLDFYLERPILRKFIARVTHLAGKLLKLVGEITHNEEINRFAHSLVTLQSLQSTLFSMKGGMLLEIDIDGKVVNGIYSNQTDSGIYLGHISEVKEVASKNPNERVIYLGSFGMPVLRKITFVS